MTGPVAIPQWVQTRVLFKTNQNTNLEIALNWKAAIHLWTNSELTTLNQNINTALTAQILAAMPAAMQLVSYTSTDKGVIGGAQSILTLTGAVGTGGGDIVNYNSTLVISERTGLIGRSHRGRIYMPPASEDAYTGGQALAAYLTQLQTVANTLLAFTNSGGVAVDWAVVSRKLSSLFTIISTVIDNLPDSQRRRLPGRGN